MKSAAGNSILEVAPLRIRPGSSAEFEEAFRDAERIIASSPGYVTHELRRCVERADEYILLVRWESVEAHEIGFRQSRAYLEWQRLLHHFYEPFPIVSHYAAVDEKDTAAPKRPPDGAHALESISPFFRVDDVAAALDFYCGSLGFALGWKWGEPPTHGNVCRDKVSISFSTRRSDENVGDIYVRTSGVASYFAELQKRGVDVGPIADRDYGMRDFLVVDPWGNRLVFGEPSSRVKVQGEG